MEMERSTSHSETVQEEAPPPSPITFASMGLPQPSSLQDTAVGKIRPLSDTTWQERVFLALMLASIVAVVSFTIYRVSTVTHSEPDFTFGLLLLIQAAFCLYYLVDGVLRERPSEIFILSAATTIIALYLIGNYAAGTRTTVKLIRMIVSCCLSPFLIIMGLYIAWQYHVSKKIIFRTVGADPKWQGMLQRLLAFQDVLKFDLQLGASMVILILVSGITVSTRDIIVLAVGAPVTIVWFFIGLFGMRAESTPWAIIFALLSPCNVAYICYKFFTVRNYIYDKGGLASATIICGAVALLVRAVAMILFAMIFRSFGKGLKEQVKSMKS